MSSESSVLYDAPGPKALRRDRIYNVVFTAAFLAVFAVIAYQMYQRGVFDDRWKVLFDPPKGQDAVDVWTSFWRGIQATLTAAAIAAPAALLIGGALAITRRGFTNRLFKGSSVVITELFRGLPVLLLMFFAKIVLGWSPLWSVVFGLVVYNAAVVAEILRAGLAALPKGQREAGLSIGLSPMRTVRMIELPQAIRIMLPALVSQLVVLLKDSSLGYIVAYEELLRIVKLNRDYFGDRYTIPLFLVGACIYIAINLCISRLAVWVEARMRRSKHVVKKDDGSAAIHEGGAEAAGMAANIGGAGAGGEPER